MMSKLSREYLNDLGEDIILCNGSINAMKEKRDQFIAVMGEELYNKVLEEFTIDYRKKFVMSYFLDGILNKK